MNDAAAAHQRRPRSSSWASPLGALALLGGGVVFEVPVCPCAILLGIPCPGCGLGRASLELLQGHLSEALALHPLVPVALPGAIVGIFLSARPPHPSAKARRLGVTAGAALLALLLGVWVARFAGACGGPVAVRGPYWDALGITR